MEPDNRNIIAALVQLLQQLTVAEIERAISAVGLQYPCPGARQVLAFEAQDACLNLFGRSLKSKIGIDPFTIKAMTLRMHQARFAFVARGAGRVPSTRS